MPRLLFEGWSGQDYRELFADDDMMLKISQELIRTLKVSNYVALVSDICLWNGKWWCLLNGLNMICVHNTFLCA